MEHTLYYHLFFSGTEAHELSELDTRSSTARSRWREQKRKSVPKVEARKNSLFSPPFTFPGGENVAKARARGKERGEGQQISYVATKDWVVRKKGKKKQIVKKILPSGWHKAGSVRFG